MGGSSKKVTVGYKYYLGLHMILCHGPVDKITRIEVGGKTAWSGNATGGEIQISAPDLFGGESSEGGVSGKVDIEMGGTLQGRNAYLQSQLGVDIPAYRGVLGAVLKQVYIGLNPYLKNWAFWASRIHVRQNGVAQWYDSKAEINGDMNPAHIIRECLTDPDWGMGYPEAEIDDVSFTAAADKLFSEGMGMSLLWDQSTSIEEFIQIIQKHIDGSLYVDPATGKFVLTLARDGYDINSLLVLGEDSISRITNFSRSTLDELVNSVTVVYWDAATGKNGSVTVQDPAQQRGPVGVTLQYPGFTNGSIATQVASRDLRALSTPLARGTIYASRKAANLRIGDVFVLNWPRYGISQLVMRVAGIELGTLENNTVRIQAVEDVFASSTAIYAPPPPSGWADPNTSPAPCQFHVAIEAPYWEVVQQLGEVEAQALASTAGYVVATGVRPSGDARNARLYTDVTGAWEEVGPVDFCPTAVLAAATSANSTTLSIQSGIDLDVVQLGTYALLESELVRVDAVSDTSLTVGRGVLDTVATAHAVGSRLFFVDVFFESDGVEYASSETADLRLLPVTGLGTLSLTSAPIQSVAITARQAKPYPPGKVRINTQAYPQAILGAYALSWAHRDRLQQTATIVDEAAASIGPEAGTTYTLRLYGETDTLLRTETGLTGTSYTWSAEEADSGLTVPGGGGDYAAEVLADSPVSYWRLDETTGTTAADAAGGNHGTYTGGVTLNQPGIPSTGRPSVSLNGSSGYVNIPHHASLSLSGDITVEAWVYRSSATGFKGIIAKRGAGSPCEFGLNFNQATPVTQWYFHDGTTFRSCTYAGLPAQDAWTHVVGVRQSGVCTLYLNGVQVAIADLSAFTPSSTTNPVTIGTDDGTGFMAGRVDEVAIYSHAISATRVLAHYEAGATALKRLNGRIRAELEAVRSGLTSHQKHNITVDRAGWGYNWGNYWGGL